MSGNNPKVSIAVPVYNGEKYLPSFIESALQQSLDDYEIVFADNCSTDNTMKILLEYQKVFPNKIFVYQTDEHGNCGKGRNLSFQKSRGDYIFWCDSDDIIHPHALTMLYSEAQKHNSDIVYGYANIARVKNGEITNQMSYLGVNKSIAVNNEKAIISGAEFWTRLIKRDLIELVGPTLEDIIFDDVCYLPILHSYAKSIRFLKFPVYYWFRRGDSTAGSPTREVCVDSVKAEKFALENCNPQYLQAVQYLVAVRTNANRLNRWPFADVFINWAKEQEAWIYDNELIRKNKNLFNKMRWMASLNGDTPNTIYVNGFAEHPAQERLKELEEKVFYDGCEVVVLSEVNCDINKNEYIKFAYDRGDFEIVSGYFALKKIYENGGIFIHKKIKILNYFNFLKFQNAFFALIDKKTYSDWIFGAPAGSEVIADILKTYSNVWDKKQKYMSLSERIAIVLTAKYGIPFDGKLRVYGSVVSVLSPEISAVDMRFSNDTKVCMFEYDLSDYAGQEDCVTLKRSSLEHIISVYSKGVVKSGREMALERELSSLKNSNTYKMMMKIRELGDGPMGPFLKKIFRILLKIRTKFKHK